jgi:hypothetical protein
MTLGVGGSLFIAPTSKSVVGEFFTDQVWRSHRTSLVYFSRSRCKASKSRSYTGQVRLAGQVQWEPLDVGEDSLEAGLGLDYSGGTTEQVW